MPIVPNQKVSACMHGTFVAGILSAKRDFPIPGICPECILLVRPYFWEKVHGDGRTPMRLRVSLLRRLSRVLKRVRER